MKKRRKKKRGGNSAITNTVSSVYMKAQPVDIDPQAAPIRFWELNLKAVLRCAPMRPPDFKIF